jgi:hypothetical protein
MPRAKVWVDIEIEELIDLDKDGYIRKNGLLLENAISPTEEDSQRICGAERPPRKVFCQLEKGHSGSHRAVVFWEGEEPQK